MFIVDIRTVEDSNPSNDGRGIQLQIKTVEPTYNEDGLVDGFTSPSPWYTVDHDRQWGLMGPMIQADIKYTSFMDNI
jgi:hypothetical protein